MCHTCPLESGVDHGRQSTYLSYISFITQLKKKIWEVPVANVLYCDIVVSEFELQSRYYVHFRTNTHEKGLPSRLGL